MKLNSISNKVHKASLTPKSHKETTKKSKKEKQEINANIKLENELFLNVHNPKLFRVRYKVSVEVEDSVDVNLVYDFDFVTEDDIEEDFGNSLVVRSQIPNYVFPYIKSYLEHFIMMSGYGHIPFPNVDFSEQPIPKKEDS